MGVRARVGFRVGFRVGVRAHLAAVHVELRRHGLELLLLLAQIVLVDLQLLRHLRPRLPRQDALELHVERLLLLDEAVLGGHL